VAQAPVDLACPELAAIQIPNASTCRFQCDLFLEPESEYEFRGRRTSGEWLELFLLGTSSSDRLRMTALATAISALPVPPETLVQTTQGGSDTQSYVDSTVSGFFSLSSLLARAGYDPASADAVLDIGCGTGRLLLGWYADRPGRILAGVDINDGLIAWCRRHLGGVAEWKTSAILPPLPFDESTFDIVQLSSVFTHLPLTYQRAWLEEVHRVLKPTGAAIVTLHGDLYVRLLLNEALRRHFADTGYVEVPGDAPGANAFTTFHSRVFAEELFRGFESVHFFPRGNPEGIPRLFPIAALQDVYVLRV
jgi:ubiquinone/menaquinone biosynthesis C-methylase UbiE